MSETKIGKNAIENLTTGMYEDSRIIFREYIQNSADQIDKVISENMFPNQKMKIDIDINREERKITIKDNATGVSKNNIKTTLADVADSNKRRGIDKGFRGIGRLGGLAYCNTLRFITTYAGEPNITIMTWDAHKLNEMINDPCINDDASQLLDKIISYSEEPCNMDDHYFIVEMIDIRKENKSLLEEQEVKDYIACTAPVEYDSSFIFSSEIDKYVEENNIKNTVYNIYVNGEDMKKPYTTNLYEESKMNSKKKYDEISNVQFEKFYDESSGELLAWLWYGMSRFEKRISSKYNKMAGLRLRQSNIQIGTSQTLVPFFKEDRGNYYFMGEIHAVHPDLIPNARRDYFNESPIRNIFESKIKKYFNEDLHPIYRDANTFKCAVRDKSNFETMQHNFEEKNNQGTFISNEEKQKLQQEIDEAQSKNTKALKTINNLYNKVSNNSALKQVFQKIADKYYPTQSVEFSTAMPTNIEKESSKHSSNPDMTSITDTQELPPKNTKNVSGKHLSNHNIIPLTDNPEPPPTNTKKPKQKFFVDELAPYGFKKEERKLISRIYTIIHNNTPRDMSEPLINKIQDELKK